ncbi:sugar ABC transporter substrate-binding protein [Vibrio sp. SCSIO 43137]|uniref:sugar ABC transporter substrate-binding protein n=1 Tax=Vibrio sp. SCSIO 43137 TaxID=3021011 RepID=UPI0023081616|nr:maltose ABC transporter substrate-binding protein [Vibrio sp. SCSIO 43137]WCE30853.1 maltose ABC transporter substrate-binding protein [Vibrio sp. SCSIO 43137]
MKFSLVKTALLSSVLLSPILSAEEIKPENGADLLIWTDNTTLEYMEYAAKQFNKDMGYNVDFSFRGIAPIDAASRLIQDGGSARVADIAEIEHDLLGKLVVAGGAMENLVSADKIENDFMHNAKTAARAEGISYGFPVSFATTVLFYNKDLLPSAPESFEQIIEFSKTFNDKKQNKYALLWDVQNYYESRMFLTQFGAYEFGNNGTDAKDIGIASELAQKGLASMKTLQAANNANPSDMRNPQVRRGLFSEGKVAAIIDGPWAIQGYKESGVNFGVVPMPTLNDQQLRTFSTVRLAVVSSYTEYPKAAQLFADYLTSAKMLKKRFEMTNSIPPLSTVLKEVSANVDEATMAIIAQGFYADAMPSIPEMGYIWSPMASAITDLWVNDKSPKLVLERALSIIKEQIELQD